MGRPEKAIDMEAALDLLMRGEKIPAISKELDVSAPTLRARIAKLQNEQGLILQYRAVQSLQLTQLQAKCLEAITDDKINEASFLDLARAYKILKDKELDIETTEDNVKGLVAHLIYLEKQEAALAAKVNAPPDEKTEEAEYEEAQAELSNTLTALDTNGF